MSKYNVSEYPPRDRFRQAKRYSYKRGDILAVLPNHWCWPPLFCRCTTDGTPHALPEIKLFHPRGFLKLLKVRDFQLHPGNWVFFLD